MIIALKRVLILLMAINLAVMVKSGNNETGRVVGRNTDVSCQDLLTPEVLWAMGRIGTVRMSSDGKMIVYNVVYYSVEQNKSRSVLYLMDLNSCKVTQLTKGSSSDNNAVFINGNTKILFCSQGHLWTMDIDGNNRKPVRMENSEGSEVEDFLLSPDESRIVLIRQVETEASIRNTPADLPKSTGMVIDDMMYKYWDHFVKTIPHPFVAEFSIDKIEKEKDILEGEPFECPLLPFGGIEEIAWSPDGKTIAYSCRKKTGRAYSMSTDTDIFLYNIVSGETTNLCKPKDYVEPETDCTVSLEHQDVNKSTDNNVGYDLLPKFSPNGKYIAWTSMARNGYESDRARLCVMDLATGRKTYITESFESSVETYYWSHDSRSVFFTGTWHGTTHVYNAKVDGTVTKITDGDFDYTLCGSFPDGKRLLVKRHSMSQADECYVLDLTVRKEKALTRLTHENDCFFEKLTMGDVVERWVTTVDGKRMMCWVVYPPHFNASNKYPTLLFCEGGPQSAVSQTWSYRWNFQLMAANGYIVVLPSRRGVPGFGMEWLEEISGDYTGLCMKDYLSAIDDICKEPYVDKDRLGCVGASFGGYSVYWLSGHHDGRFKAFIAHDGIYNTQQQYVETDELWFPNWDLKAAPWRKDVKQAGEVYNDSPHLSVDKWDTPILCIHGMQDYRIMFTQAESAFQAARMRGVPAQLLLFPDENHWVLKPQNGILWQRTFFGWLDRWLK